MPLASRIFSLYRTVLKAAGRAPMAPTRALRSPFTTRQTAVNHSRSLRNSSESGASVCSVVSEYGMPYCLRLLHNDILPQKLSRRSAMVMRPALSGVACTSTGTFNPARRSASTIPRSSPKFGSVTTTPSILSRLRANSAAHFLASSRVSTAPYLESSGPNTTASMEACFSAASISSRPDLAR